MSHFRNRLRRRRDKNYFINQYEFNKVPLKHSSIFSAHIYLSKNQTVWGNTRELVDNPIWNVTILKQPEYLSNVIITANKVHPKTYHGLEINLWIPVWVIYNDNISCSQINTQSSSSGTQHENELWTSWSIELIYGILKHKNTTYNICKHIMYCNKHCNIYRIYWLKSQFFGSWKAFLG